MQGHKFSAITVNTTAKMESPLGNVIQLRKLNFTEKVIFNFGQKISNLANKIQIDVQNNKFDFL